MIIQYTEISIGDFDEEPIGTVFWCEEHQANAVKLQSDLYIYVEGYGVVVHEEDRINILGTGGLINTVDQSITFTPSEPRGETRVPEMNDVIEVDGIRYAVVRLPKSGYRRQGIYPGMAICVDDQGQKCSLTLFEEFLVVGINAETELWKRER